MNKVLKSLVVGGLGLMMLPGMVKADVDGTFIEQPGSYSNNVIVNSIKEEDVYKINVYWDMLEFDFIGDSTGNFSWEPVYESGNEIMVESYSNVTVDAEISWESKIENVTADFYGKRIDFNAGVCGTISLPYLQYIWGGGDENGLISTYSSESGALYTDAACTIEVAEGTEFVPGDYYTAMPSEYAGDNDEGLGNTITLWENMTAHWTMDLSGGSKDAVEEAIADDSIVGSVTITISKSDLQ